MTERQALELLCEVKNDRRAVDGLVKTESRQNRLSTRLL